MNTIRRRTVSFVLLSLICLLTCTFCACSADDTAARPSAASDTPPTAAAGPASSAPDASLPAAGQSSVPASSNDPAGTPDSVNDTSVFPSLSGFADETMTGLTYTGSVTGEPIRLYASSLPVVYINSDDDIGDEAITAAMYIQGNSVYTDPDQLYDGMVEIKLRGNSTRYRPKRPYKIKLEAKANLFGMGANKHWVLLANDIDHTLIRNKLVCDLASAIGMDFATESVLVSLVLDGSYMGVYQLCEQIRVAEERVNISDDGFLLEMDFYAFGDQSLSRLITAFQQPWYFNTPETVPADSALALEAAEFTQSFEYALHSPDHIYHADAVHYSGQGKLYDWDAGEWVGTLTKTDYSKDHYDGLHYSQLFDLDSLVQNFMICEFTMNWDCMKNSVFLYRDANEPARLGPVWDFDWSFGNINMYNIFTDVRDDWQTTNNYFTNEQYYQSVQWNRYLIRDPYFVMKVYELYHSIRDNQLQAAIDSIDDYELLLANAGAANDRKWKSTYKNRRYYAGKNAQTFTESYDSLRSFITDRMHWLDAQFADFDTLLASLGYYTPCEDMLPVSCSNNADGSITLTVKPSTGIIRNILFQVNGSILTSEAASKEAGTTTAFLQDYCCVPVTGGAASLTIPAECLTDGLNMIQVYGTAADGSFLYQSTAAEAAPVSNYYLYTR